MWRPDCSILGQCSSARMPDILPRMYVRMYVDIVGGRSADSRVPGRGVGLRWEMRAMAQVDMAEVGGRT